MGFIITYLKGNDNMKHSVLKRRILAAVVSAAVMSGFTFLPVSSLYSVAQVHAYDSIAHDPDRDVQKEGVGNPFNFGERNTPANGSDSEIRAINHKMTVQEVKYCLYKEIDEHWDLIKVRFGQDNREMVYALFLGLGTRESTLGGNGDGADVETAQGEGFGVSSAHAYGTMQTAVTAFVGCDPTFMKEDDVPEMYQYELTHANFYDAVISNHMGIRKVMHFIRSAIVDYDLEGYQVVRAALKAFNTGWANYTGENDGYYKNYPDEIVALARWYYEEGHLYDNVFTWTNDERAAKYRQGNPWEWWGNGVPSLAEISTEPQTPTPLKGDLNLDQSVTAADLTKMISYLTGNITLDDKQTENADMNSDKNINILDMVLLKSDLLKG